MNFLILNSLLNIRYITRKCLNYRVYFPHKKKQISCLEIVIAVTWMQGLIVWTYVLDIS